MSFEMMEEGASGTVIKVVGVGGAGGNVVNTMISRKIRGNVDFIVANTDRQALAHSLAETQIQLGHSGLGAGGKPEVGKQAANEARDEIAEAIKGANMVFITAGMGGGTGTGASSIVAEVAQELGVLTVAVVTKPFSFEGTRRMRNAEAGLRDLKNRVHSLIVILNDKLESELGEDATMTECFEKADEVLYNACSGIAELIESNGIVNVDFEDVRTVMSERGTALMGAGEASGPDRAVTAASAAIASPLLEGVDLRGARGVLVNITGSKNTKMREVTTAMETVRNFADPDAHIIFGHVIDENMGDTFRVTVIATGLDQEGMDPNIYQPPKRQETARSNPAQSAGRPGGWRPQNPPTSPEPARSGVDLFGQPLKQKPIPEPPKPFEKPIQNPFANISTHKEEPAKAAATQNPNPFANPFPPRQAQPQQPAQPQTMPPQPQVQPAPSQPAQAPQQPQESPFVFNRKPIQPAEGNSQPQSAPNEKPIFSTPGGFASLNPDGQGKGLWGSTSSVAPTPKKEEPKDTGEHLQFEHDVPAFLRKKK